MFFMKLWELTALEKKLSREKNNVTFYPWKIVLNLSVWATNKHITFKGEKEREREGKIEKKKEEKHKTSDNS